jgi:hypothetical protein
MAKIKDLIDYTLDGDSTKLLASAANLEAVNSNLGKMEAYPNYTIPTLTLSNAGTTGGVYKAGTKVNLNMEAKYTANDAGSRNGYLEIIDATGNVIIEASNDILGYSVSDFTINEGTTSFKARGKYSAGERKKKVITGVEDDRPFLLRKTDAPQAAEDSNNFVTNPITYIGVQPQKMFDSINTAGKEIIVENRCDFTVDFEAGTPSHLQVVEIRTSWGNVGTLYAKNYLTNGYDVKPISDYFEVTANNEIVDGVSKLVSKTYTSLATTTGARSFIFKAQQ